MSLIKIAQSDDHHRHIQSSPLPFAAANNLQRAALATRQVALASLSRDEETEAMNLRLIAVAALAAQCSCAPIQQTTNLATPVGQSIKAGVGDVILRAEGRESMPNAFGGADIFGRTRSTGIVFVQYGGARNGNAILLRSGVTTQSDATTMNSTGMLLPTQQNTSIYGTVGRTPVSGTAVSTGAVYIPPAGANVTSVQQPLVPIEINWRKDPRVQVGGQTIIVEAADERSIVYRRDPDGDPADSQPDCIGHTSTEGDDTWQQKSSFGI
jgi:hypothetical protein